MNLQAKHAYKVCNYTGTMRYSCLLGDEYQQGPQNH